MAAQQQRLDALSNDVANVNTTGYKRVRMSFRDLVYASPGLGAGEGVTVGAGAAVEIAGRSFGQGSLRITQRSLDLAVQGPGFLKVRQADGTTALTRDGSLTLNPDGELMTAGGLLLEPRVALPKGTGANDVAIGEDGQITTKDGRRLGKVEVVTVRSPGGLAALADNLFVATPASGPLVAASKETVLTQGALEGSNVDLADAMVDMLDAQRSFSMASRAIQTQDQILAIANEVKK